MHKSYKNTFYFKEKLNIKTKNMKVRNAICMYIDDNNIKSVFLVNVWCKYFYFDI